jgi:hypothetical protein
MSFKGVHVLEAFTASKPIINNAPEVTDMVATINDKNQILRMLNEEFNRWEELLAGMSEEQITDPHLPANWSMKDVIAHLWAWQQRSIARSEAALHNKEPEYPRWPERLEPDPDEDVDQTNAWIYETNRDKPWSSVYADWRAQFLRLLELSKEIPEIDLLDPGRYAWMGGYPLSASLLGSYEHHAEHHEQLLAGLGQKGPR